MALTVYTYGGGEVLRNVFNAIAILTGGNDFKSLLVISMSCGAFWVIAKSFFSANLEAFFLRFFLPVIAITSILMLPKTTVHIEDAYTRAPYVVDNVPWLIARPAELISSLGYTITDNIESVMHVPNDLSYNQTGMVFGSEVALDMRKYRLSNSVLEQNLKRFSKQCIFYDLALNKYSLDELKRTTNLWKFLENNTSRMRMIAYTDPIDPKKPITFLHCQNAVKAMSPIFEKEKKYYALQDLVKHLPLTFQALTGLKKQKEELISQQLMMQFLDGEFSSENFAKNRAYIQQKSTYHIIGSLASSSLVTARALFEALIYASVIIVLPLTVLPGGWHFLSNWLWMLVWIQLWPPFYAIINYILQLIAQEKAKAIFIGLSDAEKGLSFFTNHGLATLHEDMFAMGSYMTMLVPVISYAIVKGGFASFIQLSSSIMNFGQSAATAAASEEATGNYSFANASFGQLSYDNATSLQHNQAPTLSAGFFTENNGGLVTTYTPDEVIMRQNSSELRWGIASDKHITESLQRSQQSAESFTETQQKSYTESLSAHARWFSDFTSHLSQSQNYNESLSAREAQDIQESASYIQNQASSYAQQFGISEREGMSMLLGGNTPIGGCSFGRNTSTDEAANTAFQIANSEDFKQHVQTVNDFAKTHAHSSLDDEGIRLAEGTAESLDQVRSSQTQYMAAKNRSEQLSETASWMEQNSSLIKKALNQDLVNWASEERGYDEAKRILTHGSDEEKTDLFEGFVKAHCSQWTDIVQNTQDLYAGAKMPHVDNEAEINKLYEHSYQTAHSHGLQRGIISEKRDEIETENTREGRDIYHRVQSSSAKFEQEGRKEHIEHLIQQKAPPKAPINGFLDGVLRPIDLGSDHLIRLYEGPINHVKQSGQSNAPMGWEK